jgi:electron transport complex protein RnfC
MLKRSFLGWSKPRIKNLTVGDIHRPPETIAPPETVTLLVEKPDVPTGPPLVQPGEAVKTGQKLVLYEQADTYATAPVTGQVTRIATRAGDFGKTYLEICLEASATDEPDDSFAAVCGEDPTLETLLGYLANVPGKPGLEALSNPDKPISKIVVNGADSDLLVATRQYQVKNQADDIHHGIGILKQATGIEDIVICLTQDVVQNVGHLGADPVGVNNEYPGTLPLMIMRDSLGMEVPAGDSCEDLGVFFISAEAVASIGRAFEQKAIPLDKTITVVDKEGQIRLYKATIGTPLAAVLETVGVVLEEGDRIISGGPMTGAAIYADTFPILPDTDAIIVQAGADIPLMSDYPCINCGDCIPICPARIQVNMLVRFLEAGQYQDAADLYDLRSCVDCGLCTFVCPAKIPVFQYIKLAKYELDRLESAEAANE